MTDRSPVVAGTVLAGKYQVERVLGEGGMGVVVAATHLQLRQLVAMKFMHEGACQDSVAVERFLREARAAVQIRSEHVARVIDVGTLETGSPFMVIEYLDGHDLSAELEARGHLSIPEAVDYILQASEAVAEAHSLGIVHRDLKPANLFVTKRRDGSPLVKVLDFGISKALDAQNDHSLTSTSAVMGSPYYMSPEQVRSSRSVDPRSDLWALGVILHELLTGRPVFNAETASALFAQIVMDPPPPLREAIPDAPPGLESAILRCLQKNRDERFSNVAEFAKALEPFAPVSSRVAIERIARVLAVDIDGATFSYATAKASPRPAPSTAEGARTVPVGTNEPWSTQSDALPKETLPRTWIYGAAGVAAALLIGFLAFRPKADPSAPVGVASPPVTPKVEPAAVVLPPPTQVTPPITTSAAVLEQQPAATPSPKEVAKPSAPKSPANATKTVAPKTKVSEPPPAKPATAPASEPVRPSIFEGRN